MNLLQLLTTNPAVPAVPAVCCDVSSVLSKIKKTKLSVYYDNNTLTCLLILSVVFTGMQFKHHCKHIGYLYHLVSVRVLKKC